MFPARAALQRPHNACIPFLDTQAEDSHGSQLTDKQKELALALSSLWGPLPAPTLQVKAVGSGTMRTWLARTQACQEATRDTNINMYIISPAHVLQWQASVREKSPPDLVETFEALRLRLRLFHHHSPKEATAASASQIVFCHLQTMAERQSKANFRGCAHNQTAESPRCKICKMSPQSSLE